MRHRTVVALAVTFSAECAVLIGGSRLLGAAGLMLVLLASASWAFVVTDVGVDERPYLVMAAIAVLFAIAVAIPPRNSHDIWSYVMYGRTVSAHHVSPYVRVPADFPHDPFLGRVGLGWTHARSVYGPLFSCVSAALTRIAGTSALRARLAFQGLAALGVVAALAVIWRTTRRARAVAFLGLHPAIVTTIVNSGHNDSLVGLAVLSGALLAARRRWRVAGFVLGLGMLVKASTGFGLLGIAAWSFKRDRRGAGQLTAVAAVTTIVGYAPFGFTAARAAAHAANGNTRASVWDPISSLLHSNATIALIVVLALMVWVAYRWCAATRPTSTALATMSVYLLAGAYVLPWYPAWALPTAAMERRSWLSWLVAAQAAFLVAVYEFELPGRPVLSGAAADARSVVVQVGSWSALAAFFVWERRHAKRTIERAPNSSQ